MTATIPQTDYRVELPIYRGPLDLLLYLVRKHEVNILEIPIATVAQSYLRFLEVLQYIDIESVGDFLVMASTLMEIKSRMLLPVQDEHMEDKVGTVDSVDPRAELVKQLVAYRRFREASLEIERLVASQSTTWPRGQFEKPYHDVEPALQPLQPIELWDLVSAFDRLLRATLTHQQQSIETDETPQHIYMTQLLGLLASDDEPVVFENLFQGSFSKTRLIGLFLALLELIKLNQVRVEQSEVFGPITVSICSTEPMAALSAAA